MRALPTIPTRCVRPVVGSASACSRRLQTRYSSISTTVNHDEIAHFSRLSSQWWDERGEFALLHKMNPVRVRFIRDKLLEVKRDELETRENPIQESDFKVLDGLDVLDVGCGGGLLAESLARLGARTTGVDASSSNIAIASLHASRDHALSNKTQRGSLEYRQSAAEELLKEPKRFDVVCSMEVLEHVDNPREFLGCCAGLVKPGGHLFLSTISRTSLSYLLTILAAEHILRLVAPGTHTYSKFIQPSELVDFFAKPVTSESESAEVKAKPWISRLYGGQPTRREAEVRGIVYLPWKGEWTLAPRGAWGSTECNYLFWIRKPLEARC